MSRQLPAKPNLEHLKKQAKEVVTQGLFSIVLSSLAFNNFFLRRTSPLATEPATYLRFAVFLAAALLITGLMEIKRRVEESRNCAEEALRQSQADLERIRRLTTVGELTASLAHEVNQPIAAAVSDANTCLQWLIRDQPDVEEARQAASRVVKAATRAPTPWGESTPSSKREPRNGS